MKEVINIPTRSIEPTALIKNRNNEQSYVTVPGPIITAFYIHGQGLSSIPAS